MTSPDLSALTADADGRRISAEIAQASGTDPFSSAMRATRMPMVISDPRQADNPIVFANDAFCGLTGYSREEIVGRNCRFLQGAGTDPAAVARIGQAVRARRPIETDVLNYRKDGAAFWNRLLIAPVHDAAGELTYFFASQVDVTLERERLEGLQSHNAALVAELGDRQRAQTESENRLAQFAEAGRLGIWELDLVTRVLTASALFRVNHGLPLEGELACAALEAAVHPDDRARWRAAEERSNATDADFEVEYRVVRQDGGVAWLQLRAQVQAGHGGHRGLAGVSLDVTARRAAEQRLEVSEESLRLATDAAEIGTWDLDTVHDVLTWSDRTRAMFGISPDAPCDMRDFYNGLHEDDVAATGEAFGRATDPAIRTTYDVEYRTRGKEDGIIRWVAAKGRGLFDAQGHCVRALGTAIDITARRAEADRQAFLLGLLDTLRSLTDRADIMRTASSALGQHLRVSRAGYGHLREDGETVRLEAGYVERPEAMVGNFAMAAFGADVAGRLRAGLAVEVDDVASLDDSAPGVWESLSTRAVLAVPLLREMGPIKMGPRNMGPSKLGPSKLGLSGFFYVAHATPRPWQASETALVRDVAARIWDAVARARAETALRAANASLEQQVAERTAALLASQARVRAVFATSYTLQAVLAPDGTILDANPALLAVVGQSRPEVLGLAFPSCAWFSGTQDMQATICGAVARAAGGEAVRREIACHVPAGLRTYDFSARPVRDDSSAVVGVLAEALDISERRLAEEQLRQAQKMEAVGQLTGGIAHDFNNLLTGIVGSLELLQRKVVAGQTDGLLRYAAAATTSAQRAASLTQRLLAFARRQPLDPKRVDVNALVRDMAELLGRTLGPAIRLDMDLASGLWPTLSDPHQLESAVLNLAINARDAMPEGGRLVIETSNARLDEAYARSQGGEVAPGQYVLLSVTDTGVGMTPDVIANAFDPFFTTKPLGQGTGLGLSMLYGFVKQSNGHVRVYSEAGRGSSFKLYLPREQGDAAAAADGMSAALPSRAEEGETVLVVEDEATVRMLVTETLGELGYAALEAADGPSGLAILQSDARVDLLVTDVGLPGLNGRQLADAARLLRPGLRVLFMTGYAHHAAIGQGEALEPGMEIISKPFPLDVLASRIRAMIEAR